MAQGKARSTTQMQASARLNRWLGEYVYKFLANGMPIPGNRMLRPEHVQARFRDKQPRSFQVSPPREMPEWVVLADGCQARLHNTKTKEVSDLMPRATALEACRELHQKNS